MSIQKIREQAVSKIMVPVVGLLLVALLVSVFVSFGSGQFGGRDESEESRRLTAFKLAGRSYSKMPFYNQVEMTKDQMQRMGSGYGLSQMASTKVALVDQMVTQALLAEEARRAGISVSRKEINAEIDKRVDERVKAVKVAYFGKDGEKKTDRELEAEMRRIQGVGIASIREQVLAASPRESIETELLTQKLRERYRSKVRLNDSQLRDMFRTLTLRRVLVSDKNRPAEQARKRAEEILAKVKSGADIAAIARQLSDDQMTRQTGGQMVVVGDMSPYMPAELLEAVLRLRKAGDVTGVVKAADGYSIVKLEKVEYQLPKDFQKKIQDYRKQMEEQEAQRLFFDAVKKARRQAKVQFTSPEFEGYWYVALAQQEPEGAKQLLEKAEAAFRKHIQEAADTSEADTSYIQLARIQLLKGDKKGAASTLENGLKRFEDGQARIELADHYFSLGEKHKALEQYKMAAEVSGDVSVHNQLVNIFRTRFPNAQLAAKSQAIVDEFNRRMMAAQAEQQRRQQPPPAPKKGGQGDGAGDKD